jgi:hypothetical protein
MKLIYVLNKTVCNNPPPQIRQPPMENQTVYSGTNTVFYCPVDSAYGVNWMWYHRSAFDLKDRYTLLPVRKLVSVQGIFQSGTVPRVVKLKMEN